MQKYNQLTIRERYMIEYFIQEGKTQNYISERLGRDKSTIFREIARNSDNNKIYHAESARGWMPTRKV